MICETKLKPMDVIRFANYKTYRTDYATARRGTALLIKKSIRHTEYPIDDQLTTIDATAVLIQQDRRDVLIISAYVPPDVIIDSSDLDYLRTLAPSYILLGDLNAKHPQWNIFHPRTNSSGRVLADYLVANPSTRIVAPVQLTRPIPAVMLLNNIHCPTNTWVVPGLNSDHEPVFHTLVFNPEHMTRLSVPPERDNAWTRFSSLVNSALPCNPPCNNPIEID